jgi:hypothetical protein
MKKTEAQRHIDKLKNAAVTNTPIKFYGQEVYVIQLNINSVSYANLKTNHAHNKLVFEFNLSNGSVIVIEPDRN